MTPQPSTEADKNRALFLDGIRGWASLMVLLSHLMVFFLANSLPAFKGWIFGFFADGSLALYIFFVLSGFALSIGYIQSGRSEIIIGLAIRRHLRLAIPVLATCLIAYALLSLGLFYNVEAGKISKNNWLLTFYTFAPDLVACIKFAVYDLFNYYDGTVSYNPVLWTMSTELWGSFLVFSICALILPLKRRVALLAVIVLYMFAAGNGWYLPFVCGICIALYYHRPIPAVARLMPYASPVILAMAIFYSASSMRDEIFGLSKIVKSGNRDTLAAIGIVFVAAAYAPVGKFFQTRLSTYLGSISFPLYLTHFWVMCSFSSYLMLKLHALGFSAESSGYINLASSIALCLVVAHFFRHVETFAIAASRKFSNLIMRQEHKPTPIL